MSTIEYLFKLLLGIFRPMTFTLVLVVGGAAGFAAYALDTGDGMVDPSVVPAQESTPVVANTPNSASSTAGLPPQGTLSDAAKQAAKEATERAVKKVVELVGFVENGIKEWEQQQPLAGYGRKLIAVLGSTAIIWAFIKNMAMKGNLQQVVPDLLFPCLVIGLTVIALDHGFAKSVSESVQGLSNAFGVAPTTGAFVKVMFNAMLSMWQSHPTTTGIFPSLAELAALGLQIVALIFLIVGTAFGMGVLMMAKIQIALAIVLAPVMIPWLLFKPAEFLFSGWLTFLIKGGFMVVTVGAVASLINSSLAGMDQFASSQTSGMDAVWAYGALAVMAMLFAFLLKESASIGSGIISGGPSGIAGFGHVAGGLGGKMVGTGAALAAAGAAAPVKTAWSGFKGAMQHGKKDSELTPLAKSIQPRQGSFQRMVYEMARQAPAEKGNSNQPPAGGGGGGGSGGPAAPVNSNASAARSGGTAPASGGPGGGGAQPAAAPSGNPTAGSGQQQPGPGGYSHPPRRGDTIDVPAREVSDSERTARAGRGASEGVTDVEPRESSGSGGASGAAADQPGPGGYSHPPRRGSGGDSGAESGGAPSDAPSASSNSSGAAPSESAGRSGSDNSQMGGGA